MTRGDRPAAVALLYASALALILAAAVALGVGLLLSEQGTGPVLVALVACVGGLLLLGLGVVRRSGRPPSAG